MKHRRVTVALLVLLSMVGAAACSDDMDPDQALKEGLAQQQAGDLEAAAEQYQMVLDVRPEDQYANYNMGVIEQSGGRTALAEGYYRAALDTAPDFVPAMFNLAILRTKAGATQEAIDLYERVIVIQPEYAAAHLNLGLLYRDSNEPKLAQQHLNTAIELDPSLADRITLDDNPEPAPPVSSSPKPSESASP
jgi:tetratricopeptide (TPR) repeat protein